MGKYELLDYETLPEAPELVLIRFNRPEKLNAFNDKLTREFAWAMQEFSSGEGFVAIITGAGRAFTAGRDVTENIRAGRGTLQPTDLGEDFNPFWKGRPAEDGYIRTLKKPVIAAVNGITCGMGLELALAADICIASDEATFELSEVHRGVPSGWRIGIHYGLTRSAAMELAFGERVTTGRAYEMGWVNQVATGEQLLQTAIEWGKRIAARSHDVIMAQRELVDAAWPVVGREMEERAERLRQEVVTKPGAAEAFRSWADRKSGQKDNGERV